MLTKYLIIACVALALALGGSGWLLYRQIGKTAEAVAEAQQAQEALQGLQKGLKRAQATSARLAREKAATARKEALARQRLEAALDRAPEWRDQPVPQEVQDALGE